MLLWRHPRHNHNSVRESCFHRCWIVRTLCSFHGNCMANKPLFFNWACNTSLLDHLYRVSAHNCANIYNAAHYHNTSPPASTFPYTLTLSSEQVFRVFILNALLRECTNGSWFSLYLTRWTRVLRWRKPCSWGIIRWLWRAKKKRHMLGSPPILEYMDYVRPGLEYDFCGSTITPKNSELINYDCRRPRAW